MAAPIPTTNYLGILTAVSNVGNLTTSGSTLSWTELSGGSYARLACAFTGTAVSGLTQTVGPWVVATAPTPAVPCLYGAIFNGLTGGDVLAYWQLAQPYTTSLTAFPSTVINITFNTYLLTALNMALQGGQGSSGSLIDAGAQLGTANGQPLLAGSRLGIGVGGSLQPHYGTGQWVSSVDVQNTLNFGNLATNNINNGITALAGGGTAGSVPVLSGFFNRAAVTATAGDSCILPAASLAPAGSMLMFVNNGAASTNVFADVGSSVNVAGTLPLAVGAGKGCYFHRTTPTLWTSIPQTAS